MSIFSSLKDKITQYIDSYIKLFKLNFIGGTAKVLSYLMFAIICLFMVFCILILLGFGIAEGLIELGLGRAAAFFSTFGIYVLLLFILMGLRKNITNFFAGSFISMLTEGSDDDVKDKPAA